MSFANIPVCSSNHLIAKSKIENKQKKRPAKITVIFVNKSHSMRHTSMKICSLRHYSIMDCSTKCHSIKHRSMKCYLAKSHPTRN